MDCGDILRVLTVLCALGVLCHSQYNMQIVAPERHATRNSIDRAISDNERSLRLFPGSVNIFYMEKQDPNPEQLIEFFCEAVFRNNASVIMTINYDTLTSIANNYIAHVASNLGYPVISWDPVFQGALEIDDDRMLLQLAPSIYHQCKAMKLIMERYNWTEFSIVSTKKVSQDFIDCMDWMVTNTSIKQGYLTKARFVKIATVVLDYGEPELYSGSTMAEWQNEHVKQKLQALVRARSRIMLLHTATEVHANIIIELAEEMDLVGDQFAWILTSSSIGDISMNAAAGTLPAGILGVSQNRSAEKVIEAIKTSMRLFSEATKTLRYLPVQYDEYGEGEAETHPDFSCDTQPDQFSRWKFGKEIYKIIKNTTLQPPDTRGRSSARGRWSPRRGRRIQPSSTSPGLKYNISFTEYGVVEHAELRLVNVRPPNIPPGYSSRRKPVNQWDTVGRIYPKVENAETVLKIETNDIIWPGQTLTPPIGRAEKRMFKIVTRQEPPFIIFVPPDENGNCGHYSRPCVINAHHLPEESNITQINGTVDYCCTGFCIEVLLTLADNMNFDYHIYEVPDGQWGIQDPVSGEWNGLVREILDEKADMILTSFVINQVRNAVLDLTSPFLESGITIMVSIRKGAISPYAFLEPYDYYSWILILIFSVHATGASIFIFEWLSPSALDQGKTSTVEHKFSLFRSFWLIWAMLFGAAVSIDVPRGVSSRFLANVWALFALVFLASYTANLAAFMITIDEYYNLSGIEDWRLIHPTKLTPHFKFATIKNSSTDVNLKLTYPSMHKYMSRYSQQDVETAKENLKNHSIHAFIYDANVLEYMAGRDDGCSLLTVGRWYAMSGYGIGVQRGSPLKEEVNEILLNMQYSGDIERLQAFWLSGACHAKKDKKDKKSSNKIGILNFISAFILLAAGVLLGVILLVLEHLYFKSGRKCLRKYDKCGCCQLVSLSMGKSLTFEQSVFEAIDIQRKHKCKDPICEMSIWKARHQLDMALLKIKSVQRELEASIQQRGQASNGAEPVITKAITFDLDENMADTTV